MSGNQGQRMVERSKKAGLHPHEGQTYDSGKCKNAAAS